MSLNKSYKKCVTIATQFGVDLWKLLFPLLLCLLFVCVFNQRKSKKKFVCVRVKVKNGFTVSEKNKVNFTALRGCLALRFKLI